MVWVHVLYLFCFHWIIISCSFILNTLDLEVLMAKDEAEGATEVAETEKVGICFVYLLTKVL